MKERVIAISLALASCTRGDPNEVDCIYVWHKIGVMTCEEMTTLAPTQKEFCRHVVVVRRYDYDEQRIDVPVVYLADAGIRVAGEVAQMLPYSREIRLGSRYVVTREGALQYVCRTIEEPPRVEGVQMISVPPGFRPHLAEWNRGRLADAGVNVFGKPLSRVGY